MTVFPDPEPFLPESPVPLRLGCVRLDLFRPEDVTERHVGWLNDADIMRYTEARFSRHDMASARDYVARSNAGNDARLWRIMSEELGHVGNIRLSDMKWPHRRAAVAILIGDRAAWGRGIGRRAVALVSWYGLRVLRLHKLSAGMYADNLGSIRAFQAAGYRKEGELTEHYFLEGKPRNGILMACFADDLILSPDGVTI